MIDTSKYEGHTEDIERWQMMARSLPAWTNDKDEQLVRDAVYLLQTLKDLKEMLWCYFIDPECPETGVPYEKQIKEMLKIEY